MDARAVPGPGWGGARSDAADRVSGEQEEDMKKNAVAPAASADPAEAFSAESSLWSRLKSACPEEWDRYLRNEFIWQLADGTLDQAAFRHFIEQDYIYCLNFCRAYALAAFKSPSASELRRSISRVTAILDGELELHRRLLNEWGVSDDDIEVLPEAGASIAYTRYVLDVGACGDLLDLHVALSICVIGYAEIGTLLEGHERTTLEGNPYRTWIEQYADSDFQALAGDVRDHLDQLAEERLTERKFAELARIFATTLRLDIDFWDMALRREI